MVSPDVCWTDDGIVCGVWTDETSPDVRCVSGQTKVSSYVRCVSGQTKAFV